MVQLIAVRHKLFGLNWPGYGSVVSIKKTKQHSRAEKSSYNKTASPQAKVIRKYRIHWICPQFLLWLFLNIMPGQEMKKRTFKAPVNKHSNQLPHWKFGQDIAQQHHQLWRETLGEVSFKFNHCFNSDWEGGSQMRTQQNQRAKIRRDADNIPVLLQRYILAVVTHYWQNYISTKIFHNFFSPILYKLFISS